MLQETVRIEPAAPIAQPIVREIVASATTFTATRSNLAGVSDALVS